MDYFLGIDGGQSHTTALIADGRGNILGVGQAGASNHTRAPGGRARLTNAVNQAVGAALQQAGLVGLPTDENVAAFKFTGAHLALTGEPQDKIGIVSELLQAETLRVGHDAAGALLGAYMGGTGILVLAGTGSVACGETEDTKQLRQYARIGGRGYLFADEGSAFAMTRQAVSLSMKKADRTERQNKLQNALLKYFKCERIEQIIEDFYAAALTHEQFASFAKQLDIVAARGDETAQTILDQAATDLAELALLTSWRLKPREPLNVAYGGGVFKSQRIYARFVSEIARQLPASRVVVPQAGPEVGALLLAYRQAEVPHTASLLANLKQSQPNKEKS